jgi:hypothetical protein
MTPYLSYKVPPLLVRVDETVAPVWVIAEIIGLESPPCAVVVNVPELVVDVPDELVALAVTVYAELAIRPVN